MLLFLRDSDECVPGLSTCLGRGAPLGSLLGSRGSVTGPLGARVRGLGVLPVRGVLARGSVGPRGRSLGALLVLGVLARVSVRPRGRGLALSEARDQLRVCCRTADCGDCCGGF